MQQLKTLLYLQPSLLSRNDSWINILSGCFDPILQALNQLGLVTRQLVQAIPRWVAVESSWS